MVDSVSNPPPGLERTHPIAPPDRVTFDPDAFQAAINRVPGKQAVSSEAFPPSFEARLGVVITEAAAELPPELGQQLLQLAEPRALGLLAAGLMAWGVAQIAPPGWVADGLMLLSGGVASVFIGNAAWQAGGELWQFASQFKNARTSADLKGAAQHLARGVLNGVEAALGGKGLRVSGSAETTAAVRSGAEVPSRILPQAPAAGPEPVAARTPLGASNAPEIDWPPDSIFGPRVRLARPAPHDPDSPARFLLGRDSAADAVEQSRIRKVVAARVGLDLTAYVQAVESRVREAVAAYKAGDYQGVRRLLTDEKFAESIGLKLKVRRKVISQNPHTLRPRDIWNIWNKMFGHYDAYPNEISFQDPIFLDKDGSVRDVTAVSKSTTASMLEEWMHALQGAKCGPISQLTSQYLAWRGIKWGELRVSDDLHIDPSTGRPIELDFDPGTGLPPVPVTSGPSEVDILAAFYEWGFPDDILEMTLDNHRTSRQPFVEWYRDWHLPSQQGLMGR